MPRAVDLTARSVAVARARRAQLRRVEAVALAAHARAASRRSSCSAWARRGAPRSPRAVQDATGDRVFQVFRLDARPARAGRAALPRAASATARRARSRARSTCGSRSTCSRHPPTRRRAVDGDHDRARADRPGGVGVLPRRRPARRCSTATVGRRAHATTLRRRALGARAAALVRPGVRARARHRRVRATRSTPSVGHARDRDAVGPGAAAPPGEPGERARGARPVPRPARPGAGPGPQRGGRARSTPTGTGEFLAAVRLPAAVLDEAYGSRYARHFYADSELDRFRQRWTDGPGGPRSG